MDKIWVDASFSGAWSDCDQGEGWTLFLNSGLTCNECALHGFLGGLLDRKEAPCPHEHYTLKHKFNWPAKNAPACMAFVQKGQPTTTS